MNHAFAERQQQNAEVQIAVPCVSVRQFTTMGYRIRARSLSADLYSVVLIFYECFHRRK